MVPAPLSVSTRTSAPTWYAAWSSCDRFQVSAYEIAKTPIETASMSSSADRV